MEFYDRSLLENNVNSLFVWFSAYLAVQRVGCWKSEIRDSPRLAKLIRV